MVDMLSAVTYSEFIEPPRSIDKTKKSYQYASMVVVSERDADSGERGKTCRGIQRRAWHSLLVLARDWLLKCEGGGGNL
jgi:hypothetical protein